MSDLCRLIWCALIGQIRSRASLEAKILVLRHRPVTAPTDVRDYLAEDKKHHYRDGFSMAEVAKHWTAADGQLPPKIARVVGGNELIAAHFEYPTHVWGGGTAMTDVMAFVRQAAGLIARAEPLRNNAFETELAGVVEHRLRIDVVKQQSLMVRRNASALANPGSEH